MKKLVAILFSVLVLMGSLTLPALAQEALSAQVTVTIADKGDMVVAAKTLTVTDIDADGALTVHDALYAAHEACYDGGAAAGYATAMSEWGHSITLLWGDDSGNFGYYVNNASAWSLADPIQDGDRLAAFVYSDGVGYSDVYCWFDSAELAVQADTQLALVLTGAGYDADWQPITMPIADATITVDGEATQVKTDAQGKAVLTLSDNGKHIISAVSQQQTLVPPICVVTVSGAQTSDAATSSVSSTPAREDGVSSVDSAADSSSKPAVTVPKTGDATLLYPAAAIFAISLCSMAVLKKRADEK